MTGRLAPVAVPVRIYTTTWCGFCHAAKRLFEHLGIEYEEIPVDDDPDLRWQIAADAGNWPTVPMIFVGDRFVGGYTDAAALHRRGELMPLCGRELAAELHE
jgi:glutaredoxin 3